MDIKSGKWEWEWGRGIYIYGFGNFRGVSQSSASAASIYHLISQKTENETVQILVISQFFLWFYFSQNEKIV